MRALNRFSKDIRSRTNLEYYILIVVITAITALDLGGIADASLIYAAILAALILLLNGRIEDYHRFRELMSKDQVQAIRKFYPNRPSLPPLDSTLLEAEHEVLIIGFTLAHLIHTQQSTLRDIALNGRKVKLAAWIPPKEDPARKLLVESVQEIVGLPDLDGFSSTTIKRIEYWHKGLDQKARQNIEIRGYTTLPTSVVVCIDSGHSQGYIRVEPILHKTPPQHVPAFELTEKDDPGLYRVLREKYLDLWDVAEPIV